MPTMKWLGEHVETIHIQGNERACANCRHFVQHYANIGGRYTAVYMGHCTATQRIKDRGAGDCCPRFTGGEEDGAI